MPSIVTVVINIVLLYNCYLKFAARNLKHSHSTHATHTYTQEKLICGVLIMLILVFIPQCISNHYIVHFNMYNDSQSFHTAGEHFSNQREPEFDGFTALYRKSGSCVNDGQWMSHRHNLRVLQELGSKPRASYVALKGSINNIQYNP